MLLDSKSWIEQDKWLIFFVVFKLKIKEQYVVQYGFKQTQLDLQEGLIWEMDPCLLGKA